MILSHQIANCFGRHSRKVWRSIVGAIWSIPLRYITFPAQLFAYGAAKSIGASEFEALSSGVVVGVVARLIDNLVNEYAIFEIVRKTFVRDKRER